MKGKWFVASVVVGCAVAAPAQTAYVIRFEQDLYVVALGQSFVVNVLVEPQSLSGLYSYALKLQVDNLKARVNDLGGISVPAPLDFNGVAGPGALRAVGAGFAGVKGTVNFFGEPREHYSGSRLASFALTDGSADVGEYQLGLEGYNTLGATESLFVNGAGEVLDPSITFRGATVRVVPEPAASVLLVVGSVVMGVAHLARRRSRARPPERSRRGKGLGKASGVTADAI